MKPFMNNAELSLATHVPSEVAEHFRVTQHMTEKQARKLSEQYSKWPEQATFFDKVADCLCNTV